MMSLVVKRQVVKTTRKFLDAILQKFKEPGKAEIGNHLAIQPPEMIMLVEVDYILRNF